MARANKDTHSSSDELDSLRKKISLLAFRGQNAECVQVIDNNAARLYKGARWPEDFMTTMGVHKKCYSPLGRKMLWEDYATRVLKKAGIPAIYVSFVQSGGRDVLWRSEALREKALDMRSRGEYEKAHDYVDLYMKTEPHSSNAFLIKGWIFEDAKEYARAISMYEHALELSESNLQARQGITHAMTALNPKKAFAYLQKVISEYPDSAELREDKARIYIAMGQRELAMEAWEEAATLDPYRAAYPYGRAESLLAEGKESAAIAQYRRAIGLDSRHLPSLKRLAVLLEKQNPAAALESAQAAVFLDADDIELGLLYASLLLRSGDATAAGKQYRRLLENFGGDHRVFAGIAQSSRRTDPEKALEYYDEALALAPNNAEYHNGKAKLLESLSREEEAIAEYRVAIGLEPNNAAVIASLGYLVGKTNPREALALFEKAIKLEPKSADHYCGKAEMLEQIPDKKGQALEALEIACLLDPGNAKLHERIGLSLEHEGNRASSVRHYEEAVSLDPKCAEAFAGIARQLSTTRPHIALDAINSALENEYSSGLYYYWKARILLRIDGDAYALVRVKPRRNEYHQIRSGEFEDLRMGNALALALYYINRSIEILPNNNDCLCLRAEILAMQGREEQARAQYERLLKNDVANCEALYGLGRLLENSGEHAAALEKFERALAVMPENARYYSAKARALAKLPGRMEEALAAYEKAIPLDTLAWEPVLELAVLQEEAGDALAAMASYRRCLLIYRDCPKAAERMGRLLCPRNPFAALPYIKHSTRLEEGQWLHYAWLGCALYLTSQHDDAEKALEHAVELAGESADTFREIAVILHTDLPEKAAHYCGLAIAAAPQQTESYLLQAEIKLRLGDNDAALEEYRKAAALDSQNRVAASRLAHILYLKGDPACVEMAENAAGLEPDNIELLMLHANVLREISGDTAAALVVVKRSLKLMPGSIELRELLVELLQQRKSFVQYSIEKLKLDKALRRRKEQLEALCDAVEFETEDEDEDGE